MWPHLVWFVHLIGHVLHVILTAQESVFVILVLTCLAIFWQAWETRKAAEAARDNIQAVIDSERAWLLPCDFVRPKALPTTRLTSRQSEQLTVHFQNCGRTPAWILDYYIEAVVVDVADDIGKLLGSLQPEEESPNSRPIPPNDKEYFVGCDWNSTASGMADIQAGKKHLYVYGYIAYRSTVGNESCYSYFCFHYARIRDSRGNVEEGWMMDPIEANHYS
jgi:hypothetical protein